MHLVNEAMPELNDACVPPIIRGIADLAHFAYQGNDHEALMQRIGPPRRGGSANEAAWMHDSAIASQLAFRRSEGLNTLDTALAISRMYRVGNAAEPALRLLALVGPGDLMANTPLDFLTNYLDVRLDLLYVLPDEPLPDVIPDHDIAFFAYCDADKPTQERMRRLHASWPRPVLNDPAFLPALERDALSRSLAGVPGICSPAAIATTRTDLNEHLRSGHPLPGFDAGRGPYPCLLRPSGSHAGAGLSRIRNPAELADYLRFSFERQFFLTAFEDYASPDGLYCKSRVAFIDRQPFLCHMAISSNWMVHYLNAGMTESAEKRAEEARAMANFENGFARRHAAAFDALHERLGFDYYSIDCAETHDGRLLVFEADAAAIIHLMDPVEMFPYKHSHMRKVFAAFDAMLRRRLVPALAAMPTQAALCD